MGRRAGLAAASQVTGPEEPAHLLAPGQLGGHHDYQSEQYSPSSRGCKQEQLAEQLADQAQHKPPLPLFLSELAGTFLFVYLGQAAATSFELLGTQNDTVNRQLAALLALGLAYLLAAQLSLSVSGAHLNPAYTLASAAFGRLPYGRAPCYLAGQYLGALAASVLLHATFRDKLEERHSSALMSGPNVTLRAHGHILSTGKFFASYPPTEVSLQQLFVSYLLASAHLMLLLEALQRGQLLRVAARSRPAYMAAALVLVQAAFLANGGPVLNPAHDFAPRLYTALFGWGSAAFNLYNYHYWWLCGLAAPHLGALLGFGAHWLLCRGLGASREPGPLRALHQAHFAKTGSRY